MNPYGRPQPEGFYENQALKPTEYVPGGSSPYYPPSNHHQHRPELCSGRFIALLSTKQPPSA